MTTVVERWNIHPEHRWLRGERPQTPIVYDEEQKVWNVYGHPEIFEMLGDHERFSSDTTRLLPVEVDPKLLEGDMTQMDPPQHRKFRQLVSKAFTPRAVARLEPRVAEITADLMREIEGRDRIEVVADLAYTLPVIVIAELLGVPAQDRDLFKGWAENIIDTFSGFSFLDGSEEGKQSLDNAADVIRPLFDYLAEHLDDRRVNPRDDLLTVLVSAESDGERLTKNEAVNLANIILVTGHITTTMLLGNTLLCLDANPDQAKRVRADRSLVPGAIEEALRVLPPSTVLTRATREEVRIGGTTIPADQMLLLWLGAGNRDPRRFPDPAAYLPDRDPNPHFGFGRGIHFCVGAGLTRLEGEVALNALLDQFPVLETDPDDPPSFVPTSDMIGIRSLPLRTR
jgi:cytochrome P450